MSVIMAAAACLIGYGEVGLWFQREKTKPGTWVKVEGNPYTQWFEQWGGEQYQSAVKTGIGECHWLCVVVRITLIVTSTCQISWSPLLRRTRPALRVSRSGGPSGSGAHS